MGKDIKADLSADAFRRNHRRFRKRGPNPLRQGPATGTPPPGRRKQPAAFPQDLPANSFAPENAATMPGRCPPLSFPAARSFFHGRKEGVS